MAGVDGLLHGRPGHAELGRGLGHTDGVAVAGALGVELALLDALPVEQVEHEVVGRVRVGLELDHAAAGDDVGGEERVVRAVEQLGERGLAHLSVLGGGAQAREERGELRGRRGVLEHLAGEGLVSLDLALA